ncbi:Uma2 family endonuclease [Paenibacillus chartarius]|uniref:Uma2 family endonuclease n=1 Tax=Paenibacillus chartarius TaxID=747481 RepID=A0ABV6DIS3_9BACL
MSMPLEKRLYTYADYCTWPDEERVELIDGVMHNMSPAPNRRHQEILGALHGQFWTYLQGKSCKVYMSPFDVRLPRGDEPDEQVMTVVQPDLSVICDRNKLDDKGCRGAPDLVVEILSPSNPKHDLVRKLRLYERAGVREYWVVFPLDRIVQVYGLNDRGSYELTQFGGVKDTIEVGILPGLGVALETVFAE